MTPIAHMRGNGRTRFVKLHRQAARHEMRRSCKTNRSAADDGDRQRRIDRRSCGHLRLRLACGSFRGAGVRPAFGNTATAILGQETQQRVHHFIARRIDHRAALAPDRHETRHAQAGRNERSACSAQDRARRQLVRQACLQARPAPAGETRRDDAPGRAPRERRWLASFPYFNEYRIMQRASRTISTIIEMISLRPGATQ